MERSEFDRFLSGLQKKHDDNFTLAIKYVTENGKIRKRFGAYVGLEEGGILVLYNQKKKSSGRYLIERIREIAKIKL